MRVAFQLFVVSAGLLCAAGGCAPDGPAIQEADDPDRPEAQQLKTQEQRIERQIEEFKSEKAGRRMAAADALGRLGKDLPESAKTALEEVAANDEDAEVKKAAQEALDRAASGAENTFAGPSTRKRAPGRIEE